MILKNSKFRSIVVIISTLSAFTLTSCHSTNTKSALNDTNLMTTSIATTATVQQKDHSDRVITNPSSYSCNKIVTHHNKIIIGTAG